MRPGTRDAFVRAALLGILVSAAPPGPATLAPASPAHASGVAAPARGSHRGSAAPTMTRRDSLEVVALVGMVNAHRRSRGCRALTWDEDLARIAREHSLAMARDSLFSHLERNGTDPFDRLRRAGIGYRAAAENIALGQTTALEVFGDWIGSRGHRTNLENCVYTRHGVALLRGRWTHVFADF